MTTQVQALNPRDYSILSSYISGENEDGNQLIAGFHLEVYVDPVDLIKEETKKAIENALTLKYKIDKYLKYLLYKIYVYFSFDNPLPPMSKEFEDKTNRLHKSIKNFNDILNSNDYQARLELRNRMQDSLKRLQKKHNYKYEDFSMSVSRTEYLKRCQEEQKARLEVPDTDDFFDEDYHTNKPEMSQFISNFELTEGIDYGDSKEEPDFVPEDLKEH